jgi:hypothetical protein
LVSVSDSIRLEAAGGKNLEVFSEDREQLLDLGLVDEIDLHYAPVLLGDGIRLYDAPGGQPVHLRRSGPDLFLRAGLRYSRI